MWHVGKVQKDGPCPIVCVWCVAGETGVQKMPLISFTDKLVEETKGLEAVTPESISLNFRYCFYMCLFDSSAGLVLPEF